MTMGISVLHRSKVDLHKCGPHTYEPVYGDYDLVLTFTTTAPNQTVQFTITGCGDGNVMNWGDGSTQTLTPGSITAGSPVYRTHTYKDAGTYTAIYTGTFEKLGHSTWDFASLHLTSIDWWGKNTGTREVYDVRGGGLERASNIYCNTLLTASSMFRGAKKLHTVKNIDAVFRNDYSNQSLTPDTYEMFSGCTSLVNLYGAENWNISQFDSLRSMFSGCTSLIDISFLRNWDVSNVVSLHYMFAGATKLTTDDPMLLDNWYTAKVKDNQQNIFTSCSDLVLDLSNWAVPLIVTNTNYAFQNCPGVIPPVWGSWGKWPNPNESGGS